MPSYTYNQRSYAYGTGPLASQYPAQKTAQNKTITFYDRNGNPYTYQGDEASFNRWNATQGNIFSLAPAKTKVEGGGSTAVYTQSGTGNQFTAEQIKGMTFPAGTYFIESGTGKQVKAEDLGGTTSIPVVENGDGGESGGTGGTTEIPEWLKNNEDFQKLPKDMQDYLVQYFNILKIQDTESQKKLDDALKQAKDQANPYWAEVLTIAQDDLSRALKSKADDFASNESYLQEQISRIKSDLATKKGDLTIDEQAELARQKKQYEVSLENLRESAASAGLTFSTKRATAESRLAEEQQDIVESTKRKYMRESRDLEEAASRGEKDALAKIAEYKRILGEQQMSILRTAESKLGTSGLPTSLPLAEGVTPLGGVKGSVEEDKLKDIWTRAEALAGLGNPFLK